MSYGYRPFKDTKMDCTWVRRGRNQKAETYMVRKFLLWNQTKICVPSFNVNKPELLLLDPTFCKPPLGGPTANQESQKERRTSHFHRNFGSLKSNAGGLPNFHLNPKWWVLFLRSSFLGRIEVYLFWIFVHMENTILLIIQECPDGLIARFTVKP